MTEVEIGQWYRRDNGDYFYVARILKGVAFGLLSHGPNLLTGVPSTLSVSALETGRGGWLNILDQS